MPFETVKLTASFKLDGLIPESLFSTYREVLGQLLDHAWAKGVTVAVDINGNNVAFDSMDRIRNIKTEEYFLKRRKLQSKSRLNEKPLLAKYSGRERRRVEDIYHKKIANQIVTAAKGPC
jgi:hypothetical protein